MLFRRTGSCTASLSSGTTDVSLHAVEGSPRDRYRVLYDTAVATLEAALDVERMAGGAFAAMDRPDVSAEVYAQAMMNRVPAGPPEYVAAALAAEAANAAVDAALLVLARAIGDGVTVGLWTVGDEVRSPYAFGLRLKVVSVQYQREAGELSTVAMTADGGPVRTGRHSVALDADGTPVADPAVPVHFETWWGQGLRIAGTIHPVTRLMLDVEAAG